MPNSQHQLLKSIVVPAGITLIGVVGALLLFSRLPQPQNGAAPNTPAVAPAITPKTATPVTPQVWLTPTADPLQPQSANCTGGDTTLEEARKFAGFKVLAPGYLPENMQVSVVGMNRPFPGERFQVGMYFRNLMINAAAPWLGIYERPAPASAEALRLDQKASPIRIRAVQGQLIEPLDPPNTPSPAGPNPTLTAFALGLVTPDMRTAVPRVPCAWVSTRITTPIPWTPNQARTASALATPIAATSFLTLRWVEAGVQILVEGTYGRQELLKVAESLR